VTALLRTDGIKKAYGGVQALNGASIAVDEGTVAGLIGPNGSGKTTLFNVITGYDRADEGQVWFGDTVITNAAPDKVFATGIGRTFQLTRIFPRLTVIENMLIACSSSSASRGTPICSPARCPTGSASCWSSPTCWSPIPRSSCSMSRPAG
jgi:ABC-type branched-subunit amino acid transport system ATPase component